LVRQIPARARSLPTVGTDLVSLLERAWRSLDDLCARLTPEEWARPTECPGWTVKDIMSHMAGTESWLLGRPLANHDPESIDHVKNEIGRINEVQVDSRRPWSPEQVLAEYREVTRERLEILHGWTEEDLSAASWTPFGPGTAEGLLTARLGDTWIHEQDIRRAVGQPGHDEGPVTRHVLNDLAHAGLGYVVAKKAGCPEGTTIQFDITGPESFRWFVTVTGGRGTLVDAPAEVVDALLRMDWETFLCLVAGRHEPEDELQRNHVAVEGDGELGTRVVHNMAFMI
jgi:uncharacterized protein (TIGR03083 family)